MKLTSCPQLIEICDLRYYFRETAVASIHTMEMANGMESSIAYRDRKSHKNMLVDIVLASLRVKWIRAGELTRKMSPVRTYYEPHGNKDHRPISSNAIYQIWEAFLWVLCAVDNGIVIIVKIKLTWLCPILVNWCRAFTNSIPLVADHRLGLNQGLKEAFTSSLGLLPLC